MNLLFLLPIVALIFCSTCAQLLTSTQRLTRTCTVTKYQGVLYNTDKFLRDPFADTLEECGIECLGEKGCTAFDFVAKRRMCVLFESGLPNANADRSLYEEDPLGIHGVISCNRRPSGPVGCGTQAAGFQPDFGRNRIIRGQQAKPHSWPWLVAMEIDERNGNTTICGSSLLRIKDNVDKSDIILTAAHCITEGKTQRTKPQAFAAEQITLTAGEHDKDKYDDGQEIRTGAEVRFHPQFLFNQTMVYDIALVKLDTPIDFTDTIRPICLPRANDGNPVGKRCAVAGWGRNNSINKDEYPTILQQQVIRVHNETTCTDAWSPEYQPRIHICAGDLTGNTATCNGDSGGMLACKEANGSWKLYGVTSFGTGSDTCLEADTPDVFTRVSGFIDWINTNMNEMTSIK